MWSPLRLATATLLTAAATLSAVPGASAAPRYDVSTLAGKVASVNGTAGLQIRFSAFIEEQAADGAAPATSTPITPDNVLSSPLDGTSVLGPEVLVNQDRHAAPQNETSIAVDPTDPSRVVASANDYVSRTWDCTVSGSPCSAKGDGYSGTFVSNDGGATWCCTSSDPSHLGTLVPGIEHLTGGPYDAGGDPSLAFDSRGRVYYAGLGFDRTTAPNTVTVSRGSFGSGGALAWGAPTFVNPTTSPSVFNDKEWVAADAHAGSPFRDRVYLTWTRFAFNPSTGAYIQSPIFFASSSDGGATFTTPRSIAGDVLYDQGSRPVVAPDGTLYVFWDGSTRLSSLDSTYFVRSTDGGATFSAPRAISTLVETDPLHDTAFRVNSFPAAAVAPDGDVYAAWNTSPGGASRVVWTRSTDGGATWSSPTRAFAAADRTPVGYPVTQPSGGTLDAPSPAGPVEDVFPSVAAGPDGKVYVGAYRGDVVSPWQTCAKAPAPPVGRITCTTLGDYVHNTRLDYVVTDLTTGVTRTVTTQPVNTRYGFGGGFFGDYTEMTVGSDGVFHALFTESNDVQTVTWFYGVEFAPTAIHQEDVATATGSF